MQRPREGAPRTWQEGGEKADFMVPLALGGPYLNLLVGSLARLSCTFPDVPGVTWEAQQSLWPSQVCGEHRAPSLGTVCLNQLIRLEKLVITGPGMPPPFHPESLFLMPICS